jgi:hypothetical protein
MITYKDGKSIVKNGILLELLDQILDKNQIEYNLYKELFINFQNFLI